jgi:N-acetylglucosaminyldiphosphoundecaprenol N-acetyl-beta-D-mannosaminyltransferase
MNNGHIRRRILGVSVDALTMTQTVAAADQAIRQRLPLQIGVVNAAKLVNMQRDEQLRQAVLSSDLILADGMSVVWASRLLRQRLPERVAGIDLMMHLLALADQCGYKVYCLGATDEVIAEVARKIHSQFPRAQLVGYHNGYYKPEEESAIVDDIAASQPDILFVAMTSPKKEQFLARWSRKIHVPICHGVGGSFDVFAGKVRRAPQIWQWFGMEWAYRLIQEPGRMWRRYLVTNSLFVTMLWRAWMRPSPQHNR